MNKSHCDVCDEIVESYKHWVELKTFENKEIVIHIHPLPRINVTEPDICSNCWKKILLQLVSEL